MIKEKIPSVPLKMMFGGSNFNNFLLNSKEKKKTLNLFKNCKLNCEHEAVCLVNLPTLLRPPPDICFPNTPSQTPAFISPILTRHHLADVFHAVTQPLSYFPLPLRHLRNEILLVTSAAEGK